MFCQNRKWSYIFFFIMIMIKWYSWLSESINFENSLIMLGQWKALLWSKSCVSKQENIPCLYLTRSTSCRRQEGDVMLASSDDVMWTSTDVKGWRHADVKRSIKSVTSSWPLQPQKWIALQCLVDVWETCAHYCCTMPYWLSAYEKFRVKVVTIKKMR